MKSSLSESGISGDNVYYISANLIPFHRHMVLEKIIMELKDGKHPIVVGTQIFEAGIDIDFDIVVRDLAPIDSIVQASGRANRNDSLSNKGKVYVIDASKDSKKRGYYSSKVYNEIHTTVTLEILDEISSDKKVLDEKDLKNLVDSYYVKLKDRYPEGKNTKIMSFNQFNFGTDKNPLDIGDEIYSSDFSLIRSRKIFEVFIEKYDKSSSILEKFLEIQKIKDPLRRKSSFLEIRSEFYKHIIQVDEMTLRGLGKLENPLHNLYIMRKFFSDSLYDEEIGLDLGGTEEAIII